MTAPWAADAISRLDDDTRCPVCGTGVTGSSCTVCGADFRGPEALGVWRASRDAAEALRRRELLVAGLPRVRPADRDARAGAPGGAAQVQGVDSVAGGAGGEVGGSSPSPSASASTMLAPRPAAGGDSGGDAPLQSLLSLAGAGLVGTAAIVFSFFTPDLLEAARTAIVAATGALFALGAVVLARRRLRFSAETVAGLALVFVALAAHGVVTAATGVDPWLLGALLTAAASGTLLAFAGRAGLRLWLWAGAVGLSLAPAMLAGVAGAGDWAPLAFIAAAFVARGEVALLPRLGARFPDPRAEGSAAAIVEDAVTQPGARKEPPPADPAREELSSSPSAETAPSRRPTAPFAVERGSLIAVQAFAIATVLAISAGRLVLFSGGVPVLALAAVLVCVHALLSARQGAAAGWSIVAGVAGSGAPVLVALSVAPGMSFPWFLVICAAGVGLGLVLLGAVLPLPRGVRPVAVAAGATGVLAVALLPGVMFAAFAGVTTLSRLAVRSESPAAVPVPEGGWAFVASLAIGAAALGGVAVLSGRRRSAMFRRTFATLAILPAALAVLAVGGSGLLPAWLCIGILLVAGVAIALAVRVPRPRVGELARMLLILVAHLDVLLAALVGAADPVLMPLAGTVTIAALFALGAALPQGWRFGLVGVGFGYALVVLAAALGQAGLGGVALLSLTATAGLLAVAVITVLPFVPARSWLAALVVAAAPFAIGVAQVVVERSGWTALPTAAMSVLAVLLMATGRDGAVPAVRLLAAAVLVPSLAVSVLCLGAQLLPTSASPVVLPLIAALVAGVLPCTRRIRVVLAERGVGRILAAQLQHALEAGALLTGALAVLLAVVRPAAGFGTACLVLAVLAAGAGIAAITTRRRHLRAVAAAAATGALWSACAAAGVTLAEAYLLPPSLVAIALGIVRALRGGRGGALVAAGAGGAVLPMLVLISMGDAAGSVWRTALLIAASWGIAAAGLLLRRRLRTDDGAGAAEGASIVARRLRSAGSWLCAAAMAAGLAGTSQAILLARGRGVALLLPESLPPAPLFLACLALSAAGGTGMAMAAAGLRGIASDAAVRGSRWLFVPAALAVTAGVWPAIRRDWFSIWGMWALMVVVLVALVIAARRAARGDRAAVPVWVLFGLAFVTAVVAWSPRDLRVEWFSLPLGLFLLAAGMQAGSARAASTAAASAPAEPFAGLHDWPGRARGSWALLGPGIVVTLLASVVSTFTDPLTWRAILVMGLALVAILVGATRRLAAPFLIGLIVLPIENVFVFAVQIGRGIESMPWWITLAVMGAVLLIIATTAERRAEHATMTARLRDLR